MIPGSEGFEQVRVRQRVRMNEIS